jgi:hypothetical protein
LLGLFQEESASFSEEKEAKRLFSYCGFTLGAWGGMG